MRCLSNDKNLTPVGGEVPMVGRLCDARLLVDEWRLERGDDEENPKAKQPTKLLLRYAHYGKLSI